MFKLHERLAADTVLVRPLTLCQVLCMNNRVWPWLILVPARLDVTELHHLSTGDRAVLIEEVALVSSTLERVFNPDKLNVAAIGNIVPQLHIHVVARRRDDPAWPNPVWGSGIAEPYAPADLDALVDRLRQTLGV
ncbi:histidine triad (HIT) protein [Skermanella stibiiresistens SB22]|uniref:Histidine triad (HIT) protein n=1 Tax=Skermanella stibiiresistens SB22 TaxID=1385369 RepID=W9HBT4_9PROT|nr:HIT family protein [Skermanella stibiiresistens]EWY41353.1 histidine triad (HIT) protein [Skermanella stibiiresistens SB22]